MTIKKANIHDKGAITMNLPRIGTKPYQVIPSVKNMRIRRQMTIAPFSLPNLLLSLVPKAPNKALLCDVTAKIPNMETPKVPKAPKKRVSFLTKVKVRFTLCRSDISSEELNAAWYSPVEFDAITNACRRRIRLITDGPVLLDNKVCVRGLESHTPLCSLAKSKTRSSSIQAVMTEQYRQIDMGIIDAEAIRKVYYRRVASCQLWARVVALQDQRVAEVIHDDVIITKKVLAASYVIPPFNSSRTSSSIVTKTSTLRDPDIAAIAIEMSPFGDQTTSLQVAANAVKLLPSSLLLAYTTTAPF